MEQEEEEINLLDLWRVLVRRKKLIGIIVGTAFVLSIIVSLLLPKVYSSTVSILPPQQDSMSSAMGLGALSQMPGGMGGLASLLDLKTPADLWVGILKSSTIADAIIDQFGLQGLYKKKTRDETRLALKNNFKILKGKEGIISITILDRDPKRAADMANAFVKGLDIINQKNGMSSGRRTRIFVEKRLEETKEGLLKSEEAVKRFLEKNKAIKLDDQSKAIIAAIGDVKGVLMAKEVELQTLLSFAMPTHPEAQILRAEVEGLQQKMRELEEGEPNKKGSKNIFIPTDRMPDLGLQYVRLLRTTKIQETLHTFLTQQYEMARIQEAKDSSTVQVLDIAKAPEKKTKPKRALVVLLSTFTALFLSIFIVFIMESLEKNKSQNVVPFKT
jgi:uncharacterized protein involved in exopolysaccharide biosynthesis